MNVIMDPSKALIIFHYVNPYIDSLCIMLLFTCCIRFTTVHLLDAVRSFVVLSICWAVVTVAFAVPAYLQDSYKLSAAACGSTVCQGQLCT